MSLDYRKYTYRPKRQDTRFRTSYSQMSQWMSKTQKQNRGLPDAMQMSLPNVMRDSRPINSNNDMVAFGSAPLPGAAMASIDEDVPPHLRYSHNAGYDDYHKAFRTVSNQWPSTSYPAFGPPRLRQGRAGGSWRHVKEVLQAGGNRIVFVDGHVRWEDNVKIDETPGGHLIQPDARAIRIQSRQSYTPGRIEGLTTYHVNNRPGIEHNHWQVV
ncbi:uncharacterized protein LOC134694989 isoform X1 [Mytilus trossulus]|uniref:uncharacterized protein LOC134694989 isoform X1 n=1 Tax=Mytilus trossulus TaxID=6551 RepID=UPI003005BAC9